LHATLNFNQSKSTTHFKNFPHIPLPSRQKSLSIYHVTAEN
jgi:hypothetical protein